LTLLFQLLGCGFSPSARPSWGLFCRPFIAGQPQRCYQERRKLEPCWRPPRQDTPLHCCVFIVVLLFRRCSPPGAPPSRGPFRPAFRCRVSPGVLVRAEKTRTLLEASPARYGPALLVFRDGAAVLARFPPSCSSIPGSFSAGLSLTTGHREAIDIGENSNSVGGVPVEVRARIAGFSWSRSRFGPVPPLVLGHPVDLFGQPFAAHRPRECWGGRRKLELCWRPPRRDTGPPCWFFVAVQPFWPGSPLVIGHPGGLFGRPFAAGPPQGCYRHRRKLEPCGWPSRRDTGPPCWFFVAAQPFRPGSPPRARPSRGPFRPAFR
jgi:hypothetical protein